MNGYYYENWFVNGAIQSEARTRKRGWEEKEEGIAWVSYQKARDWTKKLTIMKKQTACKQIPQHNIYKNIYLRMKKSWKETQKSVKRERKDYFLKLQRKRRRTKGKAKKRKQLRYLS
jgi:hypothetical protein